MGVQPGCCLGTCVDLASSLTHCGACLALPCTGVDPACCSSTCVDLASSNTNCGACNTTVSITDILTFHILYADDVKSSSARELHLPAAPEFVPTLLLMSPTAVPALVLLVLGSHQHAATEPALISALVPPTVVPVVPHVQDSRQIAAVESARTFSRACSIAGGAATL